MLFKELMEVTALRETIKVTYVGDDDKLTSEESSTLIFKHCRPKLEDKRVVTQYIVNNKLVVFLSS